MKALVRIAELEHENTGAYPVLSQLRGKLKRDHKAAVLEYLERGIPVLDVMEATPDPEHAGKWIPGGASLLTDGEWVWRLDLKSYVAAYDLALPSEFIAEAVHAVEHGAFPSVDPATCVQEVLAAYGWA